MADPLSLAASIAGLISLADVAFKNVYKFAKTAKDAKDEVQTLADQVNDLARMLRVLEALAESLETDGEGFDPALRHHYLGHCHKTLNKVQTRVNKALDSFNSGSKSKRLGRQLKWPFSVSETVALLSEISSHKATINLALSADTMRKLQISLSKTSGLGDQVATIKETVRRIEINTLIEVGREKRRILDFFMAVNPQPNLETSVRLRHALTGLWLTESPAFEHWLHTPGSRLWLTGIPGAGKTILAGSAIQEVLTCSHDAPGIGAAFFFCDYKDPLTWKSTNILGSIASQLARQKKEAFAILSEYYDELHPPHALTETPDSDELRARISRMSEHFDQTIIVIDGLDECGDETEDVVDVLREVVDYSERVSMALFSRDHFNIRIRLDQDFQAIHIAAHTEDIRLFVGADLDKRIKTGRLQLNDMTMKSEIAEILVNRAKGMFRWVVCQLDYLCDCAHDEERREALEKLPPDLPESYRRLLERVSRTSPTVQSMVQMCLSFIAFAEPKMTALQLRQAVSTPTLGATLSKRNTVSEEEILRRCSSLIRKSQNGNRFEFAHFTVQEFLEDRVALGDIPGIDRYLISKQSSDLLLATQCLKFLQLKNFEVETIEDDDKEHRFDDEGLIRTRNKQYPFYPYSAVFWMSLTRDGLDDPNLFNLANSLFHPSKTPHFTSWALELVKTLMGHDGRHPREFEKRSEGPEGFEGIERLTEGKDDLLMRIRGTSWHQRILNVDFRPLHMAAALNIPEICSSLVSQGVAVNSRWDKIRPIDLAFTSVAGFSPNFTQSSNSAEAEGILFFLPVKRRRNLTILDLIQQGAKPSNEALYLWGNSISTDTALLATILDDVTPITYLLSSGVVPDENELSIFGKCFREMDRTNSETKSSMLSLLRYLASELVGTEEWAKELRSVVSRWCGKAGFSSQEHDPLLNTQLSTARDVFPAQMIQATIDDDVEWFKRNLAASQIDVAEYRHDGGTLLHLAARNDSCQVFERLVAAGTDPYCNDANGSLPVHVCHSKYGIRFYETLKRLGVSLSNPDAKGMTIWHQLAQTDNIDEELFCNLIRLDREGTLCALRARTLADETLLSIVLRPKPLGREGDHSWDFSDAGLGDENVEEPRLDKSTQTSCVSAFSENRIFSLLVSPSAASLRQTHDIEREKAKRERIFFSLLDVCSEIPDFWLNHGPVIGAAASLGSGNVMRRLVEVGAEFEPAVEGTRTPLHELSGLMPLQEAQILLDAYHYSVEYQFKGQLPIEMYIKGALSEELTPNAQVIKMLTTSGVLHNQGAKGKTLWEVVCRLASHITSGEREEALTELINNVTMTMAGLGAMQPYEERDKVCGIVLAFDMVFRHRHTWETPKIRPSFITADTVREMLRQTQNWVSARDSFSAHRFLKMAIRSNDLEMVRLLLEHGVDIHHRTNNPSPIEDACCPSGRHETKHEKPMLQLLLDHCKSDKLNDISPEGGLGLLHRLALRPDITDSVWLMESLIQRGANVNVLTRDKEEMSALALHLYNDSLPCVKLLLKHGADPCLGGRSRSPTALSIALESNNVGFLRQVLYYTTKTSSVIDWAKPMDVSVRVEGERKTLLKEANALHLASARGSLACLKFLLDENLIKIEVSQTKEGWTPLHVGACLGRAKTTELLISKGFHVMAKNELDQTPLHLAVCRDGIPVVEILRKHGASETLDEFGKRPGDYAQERNLVEFVNYFETWRNEVGNWGNLSRDQPECLAVALGRAIEAGDQELCQNIVSKGCPIDVILPGTGGCTPLMLALKLDKLEIAKWFLYEGASALKSVQNPDGTPMSIIEATAANSNFNPLLHIVVDYYYECGGDLVHGLDYPLHNAVWFGNAAGVEIILQAWEKLESAAKL
ncbi:hypothetical protein NW755_003156 [Fusarium falciforme]|uniref:NACHT domain-containing protein n=1 Tax=Fusarium falciforme TaxID=195108 RepID=A0A9W8RG14_9HYPO|nr:hypothetical protein NW755_003156 [Fusarium falciforme]